LCKLYGSTLFEFLGGGEINPEPEPFMDEVRALIPFLDREQKRQVLHAARHMCGADRRLREKAKRRGKWGKQQRLLGATQHGRPSVRE
jgi:hypothetical protein